jgi:Na+-transporting methylmalonyl-CoA/oxaloacetate decarboxylase gamma subunit
MDQAILSGPTMAVVGIGTVFVALAIIVAIVSLTARILTSADSTAIAVGDAVSATGDQVESRDNDRLQQVALAAYGFHLARRVSVRGHVASTPWLRAGRQAQVDRIPPRG